VRKRGLKVIYQPLSEVIHYEGYSHGVEGQEGTIKEYQKINNLKLKEKWNDILQKEHFPNGENVFWARDRGRNKKTILVVDHYVPQYDKDAGSKTVFQYLGLFVSMGLNVKFIGDNFYRHEPYTTTLQQMGIEVLYGPWYAENWKQWIKDNHDKFDYVLLNRPHITIKYIDFIRENTKAKILYYGHDLHFVREMKQYEIEKNPSLLKSAENWKRIETDIFKKSDLVLAPSDAEKNIINQLATDQKAHTILPYFFENKNEVIENFSGRKDILFVGGFSHGPNVDAIRWFVNDIWPTVTREIPEANLIIVGSNAPEDVLKLASGNILVKGYLSDEQLDETYSSSKIAIIPLRYGAGVKGKTVEAIYKGIPLVTTDFGAEGLPGDISFLPVANNPDDFAKKLVTLYRMGNGELSVMSGKEIQYINDYFSEQSSRQPMRKLLEI